MGILFKWQQNFLNYATTLFIGILVFAWCHPAHAALVDGGNAVDLLGQYDGVDTASPQPVYVKTVADNGPNRLGFNQPQGSVIDSVNHRFFVSDSNNNRVLVYNLNADHTFPDRIPDYVLGQSDFASNNPATSQAGMSNPYGLAYDPAMQRLFVADTSNNRVLVYDVTTIVNGENALYVLGQSVFTTNSLGKTQTGMNAPLGLAYDPVNNRLFVSDSSSHRVNVYNAAALTDGAPAMNVLGQTNFISSTSANTQAGMNTPGALLYDTSTTRLFVAQSFSHRVTIFNVATSTITNGQNAVNVLGQTTFTGVTSANTQGGMNIPLGLAYDSARKFLFIAQSGNARITVYDLATTTDGENAINILGQTTYAGIFSTTTQSGLNGPRGITYDSLSQRLFVPEANNRRVGVFDVAAITDGEAMVDLLGQYDDTSLSNPQPSYLKSAANDGPNRLGFNSPLDVFLDSVHHRFFVLESVNNRVLVYNLNSDNTFPDRVPDAVLGQVNFFSNIATTTQSGLNVPSGLAYDPLNNRLFVAQSGSNRVSVFDVASIVNGENAANVLGQNTFLSSAATSTQSGMSSPQALAYDALNSRLFVAQSGNNRVTVYDVTTIVDGENAINVLGQPLFTSGSLAKTQSGLFTPRGIAYDSLNNRLFVAQSGSNRVSVFDAASSAPLAQMAGTPIVSNPTSSTLDLTFSTNGNLSGVTYAIFNATLGTYSAADGTTNGLTAIYFVTSSWSGTIRGLLSDTPYRFSVIARNTDMIDAATSSLSTSTFTLAAPAGIPTATNPTISSLDIGWSAQGNPSTTLYALYNNTTGNYIASHGASNSSTPAFFTLAAWTGTVNGLTPNTAYQFSSIAQNGDGIVTATSGPSLALATLSMPGGTVSAGDGVTYGGGASSPIPYFFNTIPLAPFSVPVAVAPVQTLRPAPWSYSASPAQTGAPTVPESTVLFTPLFPNSHITFTIFPATSTLQINHVFSFTYSYTNPFSSRQSVKVIRTLRTDQGKLLTTGNGSRSVRAKETFRFKATQFIPKTATARKALLLVQVFSQGKLIDQNGFWLELKK